MANFGLHEAILMLLFTVAATYTDVVRDSIILKEFEAQPRSQAWNPEHLETIHDDKESSLQFCACPRTPSDCICEKQRSINLEKGEIANFPDHGLFQRTNELNKAVDRGIYNKRSADDHTTLPPVINRLDSGSVLRMMYVNQPTEELRRQFLKEILRFSRMTG